MTPATAFDLMEAAYRDCISRQPGFVGAVLHMSDALTRICKYSQWQRQKDCQAMLRTPEMREPNRKINQLSRNFEPVMYEVTGPF